MEEPGQGISRKTARQFDFDFEFKFEEPGTSIYKFSRFFQYYNTRNLNNQITTTKHANGTNHSF